MNQPKKMEDNTVNGKLPSFPMIKELFDNARTNELYSKKFSSHQLNSWEDFFKLPFTLKEDMRNIGPEGNLAVPREEIWHYHESFGTTGTPVSSWFTAADFEREIDQTWRWTAEIKPGMMLLNRFPYSFAVPPFVLEQRCLKSGGVIVPAGYVSWNVTYPRVIEIIKRLKIEAIGSLPSELVILELVAEKLGYDVKKDFPTVKHILLSGAILPVALKEYIERKWDATVRSVYGSTETGGMASTCAKGNLHIHEESFIFEILDPVTMNPVKNGESGVLVLTTHARKASPLFRYVTKDICRMIPGKCDCGDAAPVILVLGRMDDIITLNNKSIYSYDLEQSILEFAKQFDSVVYFTIVTKKRLHIRIETHNGRKAPDQSSIDELKKKITLPFKIHICKKGELQDTSFLLRSPELYKPITSSDWRTDPIKCTTLSEAVVKWPEVGFLEFIDMVIRFCKKSLLKKILK